MRETLVKLAVRPERLTDLRGSLTEALAEPGDWVPVEREVAERMVVVLDAMLKDERDA